jgi:hypothetical protein
MEVSGQLHAPAALPPGKEFRHALDKELCVPQSRYGLWGEQKNLAPDGSLTQAVQLVARRCTVLFFM